MKCLSRIEMQEFADGEVSHAVENDIINHISACENCKALLQEVNDDKSFINNMLSQPGESGYESAIPEFVVPVRNRKRIFPGIITIVAAAIITGFIFLVRTEKDTVRESIPEAEMLMYEFLDGKDLNKLWHEKTQILIIQDGKGNVIQSIITN